MNIYQLLKQEHKSVKDLMQQIERAGEMMAGSRENLFSQLYKELQVHMEGEEKLFYPPLEENEEARPLVYEAYEEHHVVKVLLEELRAAPKDNERWMAKMKVLRENTEHHIREEEKEVFKAAKEILGKDREAGILNQYQEAKQKEMAMAR